MYMPSDYSNWDDELSFFHLSYNSARQDSTGISSFYLLFVQEASLLIDSLLPLPPAPIFAETTTDVTCRADDDARQLDRQRTLNSHERQCTRYDDDHRNVVYSVDDQVRFHTPQRQVCLSEKLLPRCTGPYRIVRQITDLAYLAEPINPLRDKRRSST